MKQLSLSVLGVSLLFTATFNSCVINKAAPEEPVMVSMDELGGFLKMSMEEIKSLSPDEGEAVLYLFTINSFNNICDDLWMDRVPELLAIEELKDLNTLLRDIDPAFYNPATSPIWSLITGPQYSAYHEAIKEKVVMNLIGFGVYFEREMLTFNPPLQAQMYDFVGLIYRDSSQQKEAASTQAP